MASSNRKQKVARRKSPVRTRSEATQSFTAPVRLLSGLFAQRSVRLVLGMAVVAVAIFLLIALTTFNPADPDFDVATTPERLANRGGIVGAYVAGTLLRTFGVAAFGLVLALASLAGDLLRPAGQAQLWIRLPATVLLLFALSAFTALIAPEAHVLGVHAAGWVGQALGLDLVRRLFGMGGVVLLLPILILALFGVLGPAGLLAAEAAVVHTRNLLYAATNAIVVRARAAARHVAARRTRSAAAKNDSATPAAARLRPRIALAEPSPDEAALVPDPAQRSSRRPDDTITELEIDKPKVPKATPKVTQRTMLQADDGDEWKRPETDLLDRPPPSNVDVDEKLLKAKAQLLEHKIKEYGIDGRVVAVRPGPVISIYEFRPASGVKVARIANLEDDLALATESLSVRIVAPIPGRDVVGIEIPNRERAAVTLREIIESPEFWSDKIKLPFALGKDTGGQPVIADLASMPHLLIAGATGAGKSVGINALIVSLLYRHTPDTLRLFLIDPKRLELSFYRDIPHLEGHDVVTDPHEAFALLDALVREMEDRYEWMAHAKVRSLANFNKAVAEGRVEPRGDNEPRAMPFLVCIVDELADLMMVTRKAIEEPIARLAQMARAAGIHLVLATQRPSVDVITGLIKANFPTRIAFKVSSKADGRVILDQKGAENLLGKGDMLFKPPTSDVLQRVHGAFVSEEEVTRVVAFWKAEAERRGTPAASVSEDLIQASLDRVRGGASGSGGSDAGEIDDELFERAVEAAAAEGVISTSRIQRLLGIGYNRAARIMDAMDARGLVGPAQGAGKPREFLGRKHTP